MIKYRIMSYKDRFRIQERFFFIWTFVRNDTGEYYYEQEDILEFNSIEKAREYIKGQTSHIVTEKVKWKVVE